MKAESVPPAKVPADTALAASAVSWNVWKYGHAQRESTPEHDGYSYPERSPEIEVHGFTPLRIVLSPGVCQTIWQGVLPTRTNVAGGGRQPCQPDGRSSARRFHLLSSVLHGEKLPQC